MDNYIHYQNNQTNKLNNNPNKWIISYRYRDIELLKSMRLKGYKYAQVINLI